MKKKLNPFAFQFYQLQPGELIPLGEGVYKLCNLLSSELLAMKFKT